MLRDYQLDQVNGIYGAWDAGARNVLGQMPCGAGKTVVKAHIIKDLNEPTCCIAHRRELVVQISKALAREGVAHWLQAPKSVTKIASRLHVEEFGHNFIRPNSKVAVAGVDSLQRPGADFRRWAGGVRRWVVDECHHLVINNKWHKAIDLFPNAFGLGVTATPCRSDGKGLGRHADGVFDHMVVGPSMRELINRGYLTDYRIIAPDSGVVLGSGDIGTTGDYKPAAVKKAIQRSRIVGDVVSTWCKHAKGLRTIVFSTDLEEAGKLLDAFQAAGVNAQLLSGTSGELERARVLRDFAAGRIDVLINVDLFGEGFDLPAIECVVMARPTASYGLYVQQFCRALRIMEGKDKALIIDHVGNVMRHGLPDAYREWTLDAREKRRSGPDDVDPIRICQNPECMAVYERVHARCPFCEYKPVPQARSGPEYVDGDLFELDAATLARMRGEADRVLLTEDDIKAEMRSKYAPAVGVLAAAKRHREWTTAQAELREAIAWWAGRERAAGLNDSEIYRKFYVQFGIDILSAQALPSRDADKLRGRM